MLKLNIFKNLKAKHQKETAAVNNFTQSNYSVETAFKMPGKMIKIQLVGSSNSRIHSEYEDQEFTVFYGDEGKLCFRNKVGKGFNIFPKTVEDLHGACHLDLATKAGSFPTFGCIRTSRSTYTYRLKDVVN